MAESRGISCRSVLIWWAFFLPLFPTEVMANCIPVGCLHGINTILGSTRKSNCKCLQNCYLMTEVQCISRLRSLHFQLPAICAWLGGNGLGDSHLKRAGVGENGEIVWWEQQLASDKMYSWLLALLYMFNFVFGNSLKHICTSLKMLY